MEDALRATPVIPEAGWLWAPFRALHSYALLSLRESNCTIGHSKNNLVAFDLLSLCISEN